MRVFRMPYPNIQVTKGLAGWFAVMIADNEGFPQPECSGIGRYAEQRYAIMEGQQWADAEGIPFVMPDIDNTPARQDVENQLREIIPNINIIQIDE